MMAVNTGVNLKTVKKREKVLTDIQMVTSILENSRMVKCVVMQYTSILRSKQKDMESGEMAREHSG